MEVREEIMDDRGLLRSKPSLDRDEPFPVRCRLFIWQMAAMSFVGSTAQPHPHPLPTHNLSTLKLLFGQRKSDCNANRRALIML